MLKLFTLCIVTHASMVFMKLSFTLLRVSALILAQDALCTDEISVS